MWNLYSFLYLVTEVSVLSAWWSPNNWIDIFFKCLEPKNISQSLKRGSMWMLGHAFNTQAGSLQLYLSMYFWLVQSLTVSQTWELRAFSALSWPCTWPWACMWPSRYPGICWNFSKPLFLYTSQLFLPGFLVSLFFASTVIHFLRQQEMKYLPTKFSTSAFPTGSDFRLGEFGVRRD